jgi:elongation factor G
MVAEGDDALMQEFFDQGTLPVHDLKKGLREAVLAKRLFPVLLSSALHNIGSDAMLNLMVDISIARGAREDRVPQDCGSQRRNESNAISDSGPLSVFVFKTLADPFAGRITYFKVMSGVLKNDATLNNFNRGSQERFAAHPGDAGKDGHGRGELHAGDIGAVAKLKETTTGETLGDKNAPIFYAPARIPEPSITFAVEPKTRADEDRIGVRRSTRFWRKIWRCASGAIRRRRNFC